LKLTRGLGSIEIPSTYHSNWLDNAAAKFDLNWRPTIGLHEMIDRSFDYQRSDSDPRKIWYPG
jgi:nucleoside-diphosphate-sugar epimerase